MTMTPVSDFFPSFKKMSGATAKAGAKLHDK